MRYCETCKAVRAIAQCPTCAGPTLTWSQRLTETDKTFLRSILIAPDDDDPDETSPA
jgi:hypothetical protein